MYGLDNDASRQLEELQRQTDAFMNAGTRLPDRRALAVALRSAAKQFDRIGDTSGARRFRIAADGIESGQIEGVRFDRQTGDIQVWGRTPFAL